MLGIIGAMDEEVSKLKEAMEEVEITKKASMDFYKGKMSGNNVSHSNRKSKRSWAPNVQRVHVIVDGKTQIMNVCTRCLRSGKIVRSV